MSNLLDDILTRVESLDPNNRDQLLAHVVQATAGQTWFPQPGPQTEAYFSEADDLFYGGQAGGGKTDLGLGLALTAHTRSLVLRRVNKDARSLMDRTEGIIGHTEGRNLSLLEWKVGDGKIDYGGCQYEQDKQRYKGIPHDLIFFDEIPDFLFSQFTFIKTWNRSAKDGQRCRVVCAGNPPTTPEGLWVIEYWGPWLDPKHPRPAKDGELRWYVLDKDNKSREVDGKGKYGINHETGAIEKVPDDAEQSDYPETVEILASRSRTFIRAKLSDNSFLGADYAATLDALPAEIRAAYRDGRFDQSIKDNPWQVIPTHWVTQAQERWKPQPPEGVPMCAIGVDVAQGGDDSSVLAPRYDGWYDNTISIPGKQTPLGSDLAAIVIAKRKDGAKPIVDMGGGYGGGVIQVFHSNNIEFYAYKGSMASHARTKDGKLGFKNIRSQAYWQFREALDPDQPGGSPICLPPNPRLVADLTAPTFLIKGTEIVVEPKVDVVDRLGRSPDDGDAVVMAWADGAKQVTHHKQWAQNRTGQRGVVMGHSTQRRGRR